MLDFTAAERTQCEYKGERYRGGKKKKRRKGEICSVRGKAGGHGSNAVTGRLTGLTSRLALQHIRAVQHHAGACWPATLATAQRHAEGHWTELKDHKCKETTSSPEERKNFFEGGQGLRESLKGVARRLQSTPAKLCWRSLNPIDWIILCVVLFLFSS